jgi:hypothetical protein
MEYALDGYGFSAVRILRGMLSQGPEAGRERLSPRLEALLPELERDPGVFGEDLVSSVVEYFLRDSLSSFEPPPEMLSTLRSLGPYGPVNGLALRVASATKAAFDVFRRAMQLQLTVCSLETGERGDEHMLLSVYSRALTAEVQVNDEVSAGVLVALHGDPGMGGYQLEVLPRVYRKVCQNGAIVFLRNAPARKLDLSWLLGSEALEPLAHELEHTIRACFDAKAFEAAVNSFRQSANEPLEDRGLEDSLMDQLGPSVGKAVRQRYRTGGMFTRWGLLNAVTAEARTAPSELMLKLERLGGELAKQSTGVSAYEPYISSQPRAKKLTAA